MFIGGGDGDQAYNASNGFYRIRSDNARLTLMRRMDGLAEFTILRDRTIRINGAPIEGYYPTSTEPCEEIYNTFMIILKYH